MTLFLISSILMILSFGISKADTTEDLISVTPSAVDVVIVPDATVLAPATDANITASDTSTNAQIDATKTTVGNIEKIDSAGSSTGDAFEFSISSTTTSLDTGVKFNTSKASETSTVIASPDVPIVPTSSIVGIEVVSSTSHSTSTPASTSTQNILSNTLDFVKDVGKQVVDVIVDTIGDVANTFNATTTPNVNGTTTPTELLDQNLDEQTSTSTIEFIEQDTDSGKLITVSAQNEDLNNPIVDVVASTTIPKIYKVGEEDKIHIKWKNEGGQEMAFIASDTNNDGYLDLLQWIIPHLSTQIFEIIFISKAFHLDSNKIILADIYDTVNTRDGNFVSLTDGQYARVTFDRILDDKKDITVYAKATDRNSPASLDVFPLYEDQDGNLIEGPSIATFPSITEEGTYKVMLAELQIPTDRFDLRVSGGIDIDLVIDPPTGTLYWKNISGDNSWNNTLNWFTDPEATIQADNSPWVDGVDSTYLSYNLSTAYGENLSPSIDAPIGTGVTGNIDISSIINNSYIYGGTFTGDNFNNSSGYIYGGTFTGSFFTSNSGSISSGTFTGSNLTNNGSIYGGTFTGGNLTNNYFIYGGTFTGDNFNNSSPGSIYGGTFTGSNFANNGSIYGGTWAKSYIKNATTFGEYLNPGFASEIELLNLDTRLYWKNISGDTWNNILNWFTDPEATIQAVNIPWVDGVDSTYLSYNLSTAYGESGYPSVNVAIGTGVTGTIDIPSITNISGSISGGTFTGSNFTNNYLISGGTFTGSSFANYFSISSGTFTGYYFNNNGSIYDGTLIGNEPTNNGSIYGGTFTGSSFTNNLGFIYGGTFMGYYFNNSSNYSYIYGGTFTGGNFNNNGSIYDGTLTGNDPTNNGSIYGGTFTGSFFTSNSGFISGGTFTGDYFINASSIYRGTFTGSNFANNYFIYGGTFTGSNFANNYFIYGGTFTGSSFANNSYIYGGTWAKSYIKNATTFGEYLNPGFASEIELLNLDTRLYWKNISGDSSWSNTANWFTDPEATIQADNSPWVDGVDSTYLSYNLSTAYGENLSPSIDAPIGTGVTGTIDIPSITNNSSISGGTFTGGNFANNSSIYGGTFTGSYFSNNSGYTSGGTFTGSNFTNSSGYIYGGIFIGNDFFNGNYISGGTFTGSNFTSVGSISGGTWAKSYIKNGMPFGEFQDPYVGFNVIVTINLDLNIYDAQVNGGTLNIDSCGTIVTNGAYNLTQGLTPQLGENCIIIVENLTDVTINGGVIDFSGIKIDGAGGSGNPYVNANSNLKLNYTGLTTDSSTYFTNIGELIINGTSYIDSSANSTTCSNGISVGTGCAWNGVFNPIIFYYNNATGDGDWNTVGNWWNDVNFTVPATFIPTGLNQVFIHGEISQNSGGYATAKTVVFNGTSTNAISITVEDDVIFNDESLNTGNITLGGDATFNGSSSNTGSIDATNSTFFGDSASTVGGAISGLLQRIYESSATTLRKFAGVEAEGGRNDWTIISTGVNTVVDLSSAIYDLATNIFKGLLGGRFVSNGSISGGTPVIPLVTVNSPIPKTMGETIKWKPNIDWGSAVQCQYSYNEDYENINTLNCANNGSDLPRPTGGEHTLYIRATDDHGGVTEKSVNYIYNNTAPTYTTCGADLLDENRSYYYLTEDVIGPCTITASQATTTIKGNLIATSTGYRITGSIAGNGHNLDISNITITATTTSNGANLIIQNATTSAIVTTATASGASAGNITVATSSTGAIYANGANGTSGGGHGGVIAVWNSDGIVSGTQVVANGGNAVNCGNGGDAGIINITNSDNYTATAEVGLGSNSTCPNTSHSSGSIITPPVIIVRPPYVPPSVPVVVNPDLNRQANSAGGAGSFFSGLNSDLFGKLGFTNLPSVGLGLIGKNLGVTNFVNPLANLIQLKSLGSFTEMPRLTIQPQVTNFINNSLPKSLLDLAKAFPSIDRELTRADISSGYDLYMRSESPINTPTISDVNRDKNNNTSDLMFVSIDGKEKPTKLSLDKKGNIYQTISVAPYDIVEVSIRSSVKSMKASFDGKNNKITKNKTTYKTEIVIPKTEGKHVLKMGNATLEITVKKEVAPIKLNSLDKETSKTSKKSTLNKLWSWFSN